MADWRKCYSEIRVASGLVDYSEKGDIVLTDKRFALIKKGIHESGSELKINNFCKI